jgi:alpha-tubulin suppressor-like RCC1 family protein
VNGLVFESCRRENLILLEYKQKMNCTEETLVILGTDGTFYIRGCKIGSKTDNSANFRILGNIRNVAMYECGSSHIVVLDTDGNVFVAGDNSLGQIGDIDFGSQEYVMYTQEFIKVGGIPPIKLIACGDDKTFLVDFNNRIYVSGCNYSCELGFDSYGENIREFTLIHTPELVNDIKSISVGIYHTLITDCEGNVFGAGRNDELQLINSTLAEIESFKWLDTDCIGICANAYAGERVTYIINTEDEIYVRGDNSANELGTKNIAFDQIKGFINFSKIKSTNGLYIQWPKIIKSCRDSIAIITATDEIIYIGDLFVDAQYSSAVHRTQYRINIKNPVQIACSTNNIFILDACNVIHSYGKNTSLQLGQADNVAAASESVFAAGPIYTGALCYGGTLYFDIESFEQTQLFKNANKQF